MQYARFEISKPLFDKREKSVALLEDHGGTVYAPKSKIIVEGEVNVGAVVPHIIFLVPSWVFYKNDYKPWDFSGFGYIEMVELDKQEKKPLSLETILADTLWVAKFNGWRKVGRYDEVQKTADLFSDDLRDMDICAEQPDHLKEFYNMYFDFGREHGFITVQDFYNWHYKGMYLQR